jgi:hypothetical protein
MKIELPTSIINSILIESNTFREYVINNFLTKDPVDLVEFYRNDVRNRFPKCDYLEKIPAIKYIRDISRGNPTLLVAFQRHGYESYGYDVHDCLSLSASKRFVESII